MDDSETGEHALEYALEAYPGAKITVLHVVGELPPMIGKTVRLALEDDTEQHALNVLERAQSVPESSDASIDTAFPWDFRRE